VNNFDYGPFNINNPFEEISKKYRHKKIPMYELINAIKNYQFKM